MSLTICYPLARYPVRTCTMLFMMGILGCASAPPNTAPTTACTPVAVTQSQPAPPATMLHILADLRTRDAELRARFKMITKGMTPEQVRAIMGRTPKIGPSGLWMYELSSESDTLTEIHFVLLVGFKNNLVVYTDESYTCIYVIYKDAPTNP